jgi:hypothetical protein
MQPKTEPRPKDNLGTSRENTKEILPIDQWDAVAFRMIRQELAPKGYSEIKRGPWRGKVQSNIPFLHKQTVERCQQIAAQMVRSFRQKAIKDLEAEIKHCEKLRDEMKAIYQACPWWRIVKRRRCYGIAQAHDGAVEAFRSAVAQLNNVSIK